MNNFSGHSSNIANLKGFLCYNVRMIKINPGSNFATDVLGELKKVTWPTKLETVRLTTIVIIVSLIIGLYVGIIDILLAQGLEVVTKFR